MLIWALAILLLLIFAGLGYLKGAVRMVFPLFGLLVGMLLALPLAPLVRPLVPKVGLPNPVWSVLLPPVFVFFVISIVFVVLGLVAHVKVNQYFKFRTDDYTRFSWERLNRRLGVSVGLLAGAIYTILIGLAVYIPGYLTVQVSPGESDTGAVRWLNKARMDLQTSGLDRIVAALDPTPEVYYNASDILGILYHNPPLHSRLSAYPPFIAMADRQEFQDIATDADFQNLLASQSSIGQLLENPKTQAILSNTELLDQLREIDLKDLQHYLKTGVSEKYQDVPILGRWEIDPYLTFILEKRRKTGMTAADVRMLRYHIEFVKGFKLYIAPDNTVKLKGPDISQMAGRLPEIERALAAGSKPRPQVQVIQVPQTADPQSDPSASPTYNRMLSERYGLRGGRGGGPGEPAPAPATVVPQQAAAAAVPALMTTTELAAEIAKLPMTLLAEGTWKEQDSRYVVSLRPQKEVSQFLGTRRSSNIEASMREDWLQLSEGSQAMALLKF